MVTTEDKQRILGIIRHIEQMTTSEKKLYQEVMTRHTAVAELIQNEARLSPEAVEYMKRIETLIKRGANDKVAELLRT